MNVQYLRYAVEIAKRGSINKAAEELYVAQPNLSRAIKELEKELNIVIFDRNAKGMTLTPDGARLVMYGKRILSEIEEAEKALRFPTEKKKKFSLSAPRASYIGEAFANFSAAINFESDAEITYRETNSSGVIKNVIEDNYGLGIVRYAGNYDKYYKQIFEEKDLVYELITEFGYRLVMNESCPLAELEEIKYSDLENYVEIAQADPDAPEFPVSSAKKEELFDNVRRKIFLFDRANQFDILAGNADAFMWASPVSAETLGRYGLVAKNCRDNDRIYKDVLIYRKNYVLTPFDNLFITELCRTRRKIFDKK